MAAFRTGQYHLNQFDCVQSSGELLTRREDCILRLPDQTRDIKAPLSNFDTRAYVSCLNEAYLFPAKHLDIAGKKLVDRHAPDPLSTGALPPGVFHSSGANLLLNRNRELLIPESFYWKNLIHPAVNYLGQDKWEIPVIEPTQRIDGPCYYLEFVDDHFGHALVDVPARLWSLEKFSPEQVAQFQFVGFPRFGIKGGPQTWPGWLLQLLEAYGVAPQRVRFIDRPTQFERLIVPRRITPWRHRGGRAYNTLMHRAGDFLSHFSTPSSNPGKKLFLSRSLTSRRPQGDDCNRSLEALFKSAGFEIIHPQHMELKEQIQLARSASHIAGCVGSQLHLIAFANQMNLKVLRIAPSCFNPAIDHNIATPVGHEVEDFIVARDIQEGFEQDTTPWSLTGRDLEHLKVRLEAWSR